MLLKEWDYLGPTVVKNSPHYGYGKKSTLIVFDKGEITVSIELVKEPHAPKGTVHYVVSLSLSPEPFELKTHPLNTLNFNYFMAIAKCFNGQRAFGIGIYDAWEGSTFAEAVAITGHIIEELQSFSSCFAILTKSRFKIGKYRFDTKNYIFDQYFTRVKAYNLAEVYGHTEVLQNAYVFIRASVPNNRIAEKDVMEIVRNYEHSGRGWLYPPSLVERLRSDYSDI